MSQPSRAVSLRPEVITVHDRSKVIAGSLIETARGALASWVTTIALVAPRLTIQACAARINQEPMRRARTSSATAIRPTRPRNADIDTVTTPATCSLPTDGTAAKTESASSPRVLRCIQVS